MNTFRIADARPSRAWMTTEVDIPMSLVVDPDFGLESLLHIDARIQASRWLGEIPKGLKLRCFDAHAVAGDLLHIELGWDVTLAT